MSHHRHLFNTIDKAKEPFAYGTPKPMTLTKKQMEAD